MPSRTVYLNQLAVGPIPRLVGVVTELSTVPALLNDASAPCDLVELRLDHMAVQASEWTEAARQLEAAGFPVIVTLRLAEEGGRWTAPDADRWPLLVRALQSCACVDIELRSPLLPDVARAAQTEGKALIVSHHDFDATPSRDTLVELIQRAAIYDHVIVKIATQITHPADAERLRALLQAPPTDAPLCLIGMGDTGIPTRTAFPRHGSCLAYGHLDDSTAPGQLSCRTLARQLDR